MQDRYAGDLGDFLKLGLLRHLVDRAGFEAPLSLGVVWYRTANESHNADGKHVAYLAPGHSAGLRLRSLDPDLFDRLASFVHRGNRSILELEKSDVLPAGAATHSDLLYLQDVASWDRRGRIARRDAWLDRALAATASCDVVFADPDNGIRRTDHKARRHVSASVKHAYTDELARFLDRGQSLVVYHHADRSAPVPEQATRRLRDIEETTGIRPLGAVRASRGTVRLSWSFPPKPIGVDWRIDWPTYP